LRDYQIHYNEFCNKSKIDFSKSTLIRYLRYIGYSYKRVRFSPSKKPNEELYTAKKNLIEKYDLMSQNGKIDLYFFDESGFSIKSNIPYAWSKIKETMVIKSFHAKRLNVLGFINKSGILKSYLKETSVNADIVIEVFDDFASQIEKTTVVVLDNASIHKSKKFKNNISKWANQGLNILYLPPYSPELNIIEILWKFIKYYWIEMSAYKSYDKMKEYVQRMLMEYGSKRIINFTSYLKTNTLS
jgi:transposase